METRYKYTDEKGEHLHTLDGKPLIGTSTVTKVLAKPLTWWASGMACGKMGWVNPKLKPKDEVLSAASEGLAKIKAMDVEGYVKLLATAYRAHDDKKKDSAEAGTDMHAELESYVRVCLGKWGFPVEAPEGSVEPVKIFAKWSMENVHRFIWSEMHVYSEALWTGGICDVGAVMKDMRLAIIDFKSSKEAYFDQFVQAGGYALEFEENGGFTANGEKVMDGKEADVLVIVPFGAENPEPKVLYEVIDYKDAFKAAAKLHKLNSAY